MALVDWSLLQSFVAVVDAGSLAAAARKSGGSQPTMTRHITVLEQALGVRLFDRTAGGLVLTETGVTLYEDAKTMAQAAARIELSAAGQSEAIAGTIRISASEVMAAWVLPEILRRLHESEPDIEIELVSSDHTNNLLLREADIAVRMFQPVQTELIARKVGTVELGMFASNDYIARRGEPRSIGDFAHHTVIAGDVSTEILEGFRAAGIPATRDYFAFRCDSRLVQWQMVIAGFGVGFIQGDVGKRTAGVLQLLPHLKLGDLPVWLVSHAELRTSRRVRRVFDFLADELGDRYRPAG
jgi:DNA-binding transcriptional LysR family regulator